MNAGQPGFSNMILQMRQQAMMQPMGMATAHAPVMSMGAMGGMSMPGAPFTSNIEGVCRAIMTSVITFHR